jgi:hypothetical protein
MTVLVAKYSLDETDNIKIVSKGNYEQLPHPVVFKFYNK